MHVCNHPNTHLKLEHFRALAHCVATGHIFTSFKKQLQLYAVQYTFTVFKEIPRNIFGFVT